MDLEDKAIQLGHPSYVWRFGQDRRLALMRRYASLEGRRILDVGCGLGMYVRQFRAFSGEVYGVDLDPEKIVRASGDGGLPNLLVASAEALPFPAEHFDIVLSHEVIEHVYDDRQALAEALRVLKTGGRLLVFAPNRLYPFETHGIYWRGRYHFGNIPLVNYLPGAWHRKLVPHVRSYTGGGLRRLFRGLPCHVEHHRVIYPGYDNVIARRPLLGRGLRALTYALESTPLSVFGLSHFVVLCKR